MRKILLFLLIFIVSASASDAKHITGGEVLYEYLRPGNAPGSRVFRITLRLFRDENCLNCADLPVNVTMGVFNNDNNSLLGGNYRVVNLNSSSLLPVNPLPPCVTNPPTLIYRMGLYPFEIELPNNGLGYTATFQTCCRIDNIQNTGNSVGATYTGRIPSVITDNSPRFTTSVSVVCFNKGFTLNFSAVDPDPGDSLVYSFCNAFNGGDARDASFATPAAPPYNSITYTNGFTGLRPLGNQATINPSTGIISGIAPDAGRYVVSVCINVFRNGVFIAQHRKDFIVTVAPCDFAITQLNPDYLSCDGFTFDFFNLSNSPLNQTYYWDFGDPGSGNNNISNSPTPTHTFSDTGVYVIKVVVNRGTSCSDSTLANVRVYPGFFPGFTDNTPVCKGNPVQFNDATRANHGNVNNWRWDFGDPSTTTDTSTQRNPSYIYPNPGTYPVRLIVGSDKGCLDTITLPVTIVEKPAISVTRDTLICDVDTISLNVTAPPGGIIAWSPDYNISSLNSFNPLVSPDVTTTYYLVFTDATNCIARDSVKVNVRSGVFVQAGADTTICRTDAVTLSLNTDGLYFEWTPAASLNNPNERNPQATPTAPVTSYTVSAYISPKCFGTDSIIVRTVPYPSANATGDTSLCFGFSTRLSASGGSAYNWTPPVFLSNPNIANPVVQNPATGVRYIVSVTDTLGCPKPSFDTVFVDVIRVNANAGPRDTSVVIGQPLQLNATGGSVYQWSPFTWLSNPNSASPVSFPEDDIQYVVMVTDGPGCTGYDTINVKLYRLQAGIELPTAFSPNGDGLNDIFKPILLGMRSLDLFRVYNRWGQLIFSTSEQNKGWDGAYRSSPQAAGTYVWMAEGVTYDNRKISRKGTVVLIR